MARATNQNIGKIYYLIPEAHTSNYSPRSFMSAMIRGDSKKHIRENWFKKPKPIGGVKVAYQHCMILRELGYEAYPVRLGRYEGNFFGYPIRSLRIEDVGYKLSPRDVVVVPEYLPDLIERFDGGCRVLFAQNWSPLYQRAPINSLEASYSSYGYDQILSCSQFISEKLYREPPDRVSLVNNYIDHSVFQPSSSSRISGRIMALPRKNIENLRTIQSLLKKEGYQFALLDGLSEAEIAVEYQKSDIFLATGYPEGFGLPPLEAMACGACVVGFTGGGAGEFMINGKTALVADDGDVEEAARLIKTLVKDPGLKDEIRAAGMQIAQKYSRNRSTTQLENFYGSLRR